MERPACSNTVEIYIQTHKQATISTALHPPKVWEQYVHDAGSILKRTHLE